MLTRLRVLALPALLIFGATACTSSFEPTGPNGPGPSEGEDPPGEGGGEGEDPGEGGDPGGGEDPGGGDPIPAVDFDVTLDTLTADLALGETKAFQVTVGSINNFAGTVNLAALDLPDTWSVTFTPSADVVVPAGGVGSAMAIIEVPTDALAATATVRVTGTSVAVTEVKEAPVAITVRPELTLRIPAGSVDNPADAFGPGGTVAVRYVAPGTKITWVNGDTVAHRIHASDGDAGLGHQGNNMGPGGSYEVTITQRGTYEYNCHIHGQMRGVLIVE